MNQFRVVHTDLDGEVWRSLKAKGWYRYKHLGAVHYLYMASDISTQTTVVYYGK